MIRKPMDNQGVRYEFSRAGGKVTCTATYSLNGTEHSGTATASAPPEEITTVVCWGNPEDQMRKAKQVAEAEYRRYALRDQRPIDDQVVPTRGMGKYFFGSGAPKQGQTYIAPECMVETPRQGTSFSPAWQRTTTTSWRPHARHRVARCRCDPGTRMGASMSPKPRSYSTLHASYLRGNLAMGRYTTPGATSHVAAWWRRRCLEHSRTHPAVVYTSYLVRGCTSLAA